MTGIANVEAGIEHFFQNLTGHHPAVQEALTFLKNSITTVAKDIETVGLPVVKSAALALATEAAGALNGTTTKAAAGSAAIATVATAFATVSKDTLHIVATDLLTDVAGLVGTAPAAPAVDPANSTPAAS